jgi:hypothetical protein
MNDFTVTNQKEFTLQNQCRDWVERLYYAQYADNDKLINLVLDEIQEHFLDVSNREPLT